MIGICFVGATEFSKLSNNPVRARGPEVQAANPANSWVRAPIFGQTVSDRVALRQLYEA